MLTIEGKTLPSLVWMLANDFQRARNISPVPPLQERKGMLC